MCCRGAACVRPEDTEAPHAARRSGPVALQSPNLCPCTELRETLPSRTDASPTDAPWNPLGAHRNHFFLLNSFYGPGAARSMFHNVPWGCRALGILHCCGGLNNLSSQNPGGQSLKPRCDRAWGGYAPQVLLLWAGCAPWVLLGPPGRGQGVLPGCSWWLLATCPSTCCSRLPWLVPLLQPYPLPATAPCWSLSGGCPFLDLGHPQCLS